MSEQLKAFPYVNGGLFADENVLIPPFTDELRTMLLDQASDEFDWSDISPTIFGAVFESTLNPETRRKGGMHYTSIENIHKVIDPLFLDDLKDELSHLKEMMGYIVKYRNLKITPHKDLTNMFSLIEKGGCGNIDFFYQVSLYLENAKDIRNESSKDDSFPFIMELIRKLEECDSLRNEIERIITKDLQITDNASPLLRDIRKSLHQEESGQQKIINQLLLKYKDYLNNERVALRNGAFALPIKAHYKSRVDGIVIDESDTGLTLFIEPSEIIASNNKIMRLKEKEKEEINRIIDELTLHVLNHGEEIRIDQEILCYMDFLLSKANYALDEDDIVGELVDERIISLKGARHPLIDKKKVVRNSYILDKQKIMLITGPNAGGKTVSIKLIGLCIIMHQCALALPTIEEAKLCFFENLYV